MLIEIAVYTCKMHELQNANFVFLKDENNVKLEWFCHPESGARWNALAKIFSSFKAGKRLLWSLACSTKFFPFYQRCLHLFKRLFSAKKPKTRTNHRTMASLKIFWLFAQKPILGDPGAASRDDGKFLPLGLRGCIKPSPKGYSRSWAQLGCFFFRATNWTHTLTSRLAWFLQCFHILSFNCQGLSNLLSLLSDRFNELETALIYNNKIKLVLK